VLPGRRPPERRKWQRGKGKEKREAPALSLFPSLPAQKSPIGSLCGGESFDIAY